MQRHWLTWLSAVALFALPVAACGDDDDGDGAGGSGGANAGSGAGGRTSGGSGGRSGSGGSPNNEGGSGGNGTTGGRGGAGAGGSAGSEDNGDAGVPETYAAIEKVSDRTLTGANDLRGLAYSASGKIWASGHTDADATNRKLVVARFNADGTPDTEFGEGGFLVKDVVPGDEQSLGIVELSNGDVVVQANVSDGQGGAAITDSNPTPGAAGARTNGANVVLLRFTSAGEPVNSFGPNGDGIAPVLFGWAPADDASWPVPTYNSSLAAAMQYSGPGFPSDQAWGLVVDNSGGTEKLVVNGFGPARKLATGTQRFDNDRYVAKLLASDGSADPTFNGGVSYTFNTQEALSDGGRRAIVESDGTIISSGYTNLGTGLGNHVVLLRLKPDGTPDTDFGFGTPSIPGVAVFNPFVANGGVAECYGVARQENGRYITTGYGRATAANTPSTYGYATTDMVDLVSFAVKSDGKGVDTTWGNEGTRAIQSEESNLGGTEDRGRDLAVLADGRTVQIGRFGVDPAIFVVTPDGELDRGVGTRGVITYPALTSTVETVNPSHFFGLAVSKDGKHIAASTNNHPAGVILAVLSVADAP